MLEGQVRRLCWEEGNCPERDLVGDIDHDHHGEKAEKILVPKAHSWGDVGLKRGSTTCQSPTYDQHPPPHMLAHIVHRTALSDRPCMRIQEARDCIHGRMYRRLYLSSCLTVRTLLFIMVLRLVKAFKKGAYSHQYLRHHKHPETEYW